MFAKNERGYKPTAINNRFWSLLILLLSVASIWRKLLKTSHTEERIVHTNWGSWKIKQIILILNPEVIDNFSMQLYIINIYQYFLFFKINISLKTCFHDWLIPVKYGTCRLHYKNPQNRNVQGVPKNMGIRYRLFK